VRSIGTRLLLAVTLPLAIIALVGTAYAWRRTDSAVREKTRNDAVGLAEFVATSFSAVDDRSAGAPPRVAHRAVTNAVRSSWSAMKLVTGLRVVGRDGQVKWSRDIEEEDKPFADGARVLAVASGRATFNGPTGMLPWSSGGGGEVLYPLGGAACGGCHTGESTMRAGVLQLTVDEPALRSEVAHVFSDALWFVAFILAVLSGIVVIVVRALVSARVTRLAAIMKRAEDGDLVVRAPDLGDDELGRLASAFNRMLARLTELKVTEIESQRDLEHARVELELKGELERHVGELKILFELARTIASTLDLNEVLTRVTDVVPNKLKVPKFSIMLLNAEGVLEVLKAWPANVGTEGLSFSIGEGICGRAAESRKLVYVPDLERDAQFRVREGAGARGTGCLLAVPMVHGGELLGVLNFERHEKSAFSAQEIEFLSSVADHAAMAVQNARLHEQTVAMSVTDPLTGIANRRHLFQQLDAEITRATRFKTPLSLLMVDIDHFKHLNDTAGHRAGDDVLKQVCQQLKRNIRKVDTLARYGGEEFVILLPQVPPAEALEVAEKLRAAVADTALEHGRTQPGGRVTISIGVATLPDDSEAQARLIDCADAALYASKRGGCNKATAFAAGMEQHPGRERGPNAQRKRTGEQPAVKLPQ
jgi:diguanylate cyclase (GGDEF)-like protein